MIIPQKPYVDIPAKIAKNIKSELIFVFVLTKYFLINPIIIDFTKVYAIRDMTIRG